MKLVRVVKRLEAAAAQRAARRARRGSVGLVWTMEETHVDLASLPEGAAVAIDLVVTGDLAGTPTLRTFERRAIEAGDIGRVFDGMGREVGRVLSRDGSMLTLELEDGFVWPGAV